MPELPEVETVKNVLKQNLLNLKITKVDVFYPPMIKTNLNEFLENLVGEEFLDVKRYGKWLVFETTNYALVSHLRMEGKYYYTLKCDREKHEHVIFHLDNGYVLRYKDVRKFGVMYLVKKEKLFTDTPLSELGLEPFSKDLNEDYLLEKFKTKRLPIKTVLLDQGIMTGLGNIYVDEVLFKSKISPFKKANLLNANDCKAIIESSKEILTDAIKLGGTTIRSYTSSLGVTGSYQDKLLVHTRKICPVCNSPILVKKIGGRSTYYCQKCQKVEDEQNNRKYIQNNF